MMNRSKTSPLPIVHGEKKEGKVKYFAVEGLVGVGKSSVLSHLEANNPTWHFISEPVEEYARYGEGVHNPLLCSYENPHLNAAIAQLHVMRVGSSHYDRHLSRAMRSFPAVSPVVSERSMHSPQAFIATNRRRGAMSSFVERFLLDELRDLTQSIPDPDVFIFLNADVELCKERIRGRARIYESNCSSSFLTDLKAAYEELFDRISAKVVNVSITEEDSVRSVADRVQLIINEECAFEGFFPFTL